jgi:NAD(P)-dependent dehydrogenase (short-subunit alcohol dehydrogenase family)
VTTPFSLDGKTILVTGASSGIGRATAVAISRMGGKVVLTGRDEGRLRETLALLDGDGHLSLVAQLTDADERTALVSRVPPLHGVVHSAGITKLVPFQAISEKHLQEIHDINYKSPLFLTQLLLKKKLLVDHSSIVFLASTAGLLGAKALAVYAGTKGAILATARVLALEVAVRGIRVNCIAPALVETPMMVQTETAVSSDTFSANLKLYPLGLGKPEDVANAAVFLLSSASRWVTGSTIVLDGGFACQ